MVSLNFQPGPQIIQITILLRKSQQQQQQQQQQSHRLIQQESMNQSII